MGFEVHGIVRFVAVPDSTNLCSNTFHDVVDVFRPECICVRRTYTSGTYTRAMTGKRRKLGHAVRSWFRGIRVGRDSSDILPVFANRYPSLPFELCMSAPLSPLSCW